MGKKHITEATVTRWMRDGLEKLRRESGGRLWFCKLHGGPMQRAGLPDYLVVIGGDAIFVEVKRPDGKVSRIQKVEFTRIEDAGSIVYVVRDKSGVEVILITLAILIKEE